MAKKKLLKSNDTATWLRPKERDRPIQEGLSYAVLKGRAPGAYPDAIGAYKQIKDFPEADCYECSSLSDAMMCYIYKSTFQRRKVNEKDLYEIIYKNSI